jgi:hypothetical protein
MKRGLWYKAIVRDRDGKVLSQERKKSRSMLGNWYRILYAHMASTSTSSVHTSGNSWGVTSFGDNWKFAAAANEDYIGIVIGTGLAAVTIDDYKLESQIMQGMGPGQMRHLASTPGWPSVAGSNCDFLTSRTFLNNSGNSITVRESGIYCRVKGPTYYGYACIVRDVLATPQDVPDGGSITIDYTLRITV